MRLPFNAFQVEENTELLRARRLHEMKHVDALPAEHLASPNVAIYELNHVPSRNAACDLLGLKFVLSVVTLKRLRILSAALEIWVPSTVHAAALVRRRRSTGSSSLGSGRRV